MAMPSAQVCIDLMPATLTEQNEQHIADVMRPGDFDSPLGMGRTLELHDVTPMSQALRVV